MSAVRALVLLAAVLVSGTFLPNVGTDPLPAVVHPVLFAQVPDPQHEGHKMRPDGQTCKTTGPEACHCTVRICTTDDQGNVADYDMSSSCQWFCSKENCTCHVCLEKCPDDGPH